MSTACARYYAKDLWQQLCFVVPIFQMSYCQPLCFICTEVDELVRIIYDDGCIEFQAQEDNLSMLWRWGHFSFKFVLDTKGGGGGGRQTIKKKTVERTRTFLLLLFANHDMPTCMFSTHTCTCTQSAVSHIASEAHRRKCAETVRTTAAGLVCCCCCCLCFCCWCCLEPNVSANFSRRLNKAYATLFQVALPNFRDQIKPMRHSLCSRLPCPTFETK